MEVTTLVILKAPIFQQSRLDPLVYCEHGISHVFCQSCFTPAHVHICMHVHSEVFTKHPPPVRPCAQRWVPDRHGPGPLWELNLKRKTDAAGLLSPPPEVLSLSFARQTLPFRIPSGFRTWKNS